MKIKDYDFQGWATKNDIRCTDGKTIRRNAFIEDDGKVVPLLWNHRHDDPMYVIGHALLENRDDGVWFYAKVNDTERGKVAKQLIDSKDIRNVSIYANKVKSEAGNVIHGCIRELSLVLAPANSGATIEHSDTPREQIIEYPVIMRDGFREEVYDEVIIHSAMSIDNTPGEIPYELLIHADDDPEETEEKMQEEKKEKTVGDVWESFTDAEKDAIAQIAAGSVDPDSIDDDERAKLKKIYDGLDEDKKKVANYIIGQASEELKKKTSKPKSKDEDADEEDEEDVKHYDYDDDEDDKDDFYHYDDEYEGGYEESMKYNVFDETTNTQANADELMHSAMPEIIDDAKKGRNSGLLSDNFIEHADQFGIEGIEWLFPNDKELNNPPTFLRNDPTDWVNVVTSGVHRTPFSRVRSTFADLTEDEARAKGYIKGNMKKEQVFTLLRRSTTPQTVYKKQKLHRDDVIDITDFDVVAWIKGEMREMLNEEIARAILIGDGRSSAEEDKIDETHIRPIANDADLFTIKAAVTAGDDMPANFIKAALKARSKYRGKGSPTLFTTSEVLTDMLLLEDKMGRSLYDSESALATKLRVNKIVEVPVMENATIGGKKVLGIIVNLGDYNVGADKGGSVNMFEDFDIDFNLQKYLIETRISGALTTPYSAIVLFEGNVPTSVDGGLSYSKTVASGDEDEQVNP